MTTEAEMECGRIVQAMTTALELCNKENARLHEQIEKLKHENRKQGQFTKRKRSLIER